MFRCYRQIEHSDCGLTCIRINETSIVHNISVIGKGKTVVIAAHRLSTVRNADKIVFIKNGMISETGTHDELVKLKGDYWRLVKNQLNNSLESSITWFHRLEMTFH